LKNKDPTIKYFLTIRQVKAKTVNIDCW